MSRRLVWSAALGLVVAGAATVGWWLDRDATLAAAARFAVARSGGALQLEGVSGTLLRPIHIDRLVWNDDGQQIALDDTTVHWSPAWLLLATASFHDVHVNAATVTIVDNGERRPPPSIPQSLRIPLRLRFHDTVVDRFVLVRNGKSDESSQLRFDVAAGWRTWSMSLARITTPWGDMRGDLAVAAAPPFAVKGGLQVKRAGDRPLTLDVSADGVLDRIEIKAALRAQSSAADASLLYTPFAERPVERAEAALTAVDLRHLMNDAPEAVLDGALHAAATAGRLQGTVTMRNRVPGTIDGGRLPFTSLAADIGAESDAWTLAAMEVDLGSAGKLSGSGRVTADRAAISVRGENINLRAADGRLQSTRLAAIVEASGTLDAQDLRVSLAQPGYRINLDGTITADAATLRRARAEVGDGWVEASGRVGFDPARPFELRARLSRFDPARLGHFRPARLNGRVSASGSVLPILQVRADVDLAPSTAFGLPASGTMRWRSRGIDDSRTAIDAKATIGDTRLRVNGQLVNPEDLRSLDLLLSLGGRDLSQLYAIFGLPFPPTPEYQLDGRLRYADRVWSLMRFTGRVGRSDVSGDFLVDRKPARPFMRADLTSERLDMRDLGGFVGIGEAAPANPPGRVLPHSEYRLDKLNAADADIQFTGRRIRNETLPLNRMATHLMLRGGVLTLDPIKFGTAGGDIEGKVTLDAHQTPIAAAADLKGRELALDRLAPGIKAVLQDPGRLDGRVRLAMRGNSVAAMLATANGDVAVMTRNGTVSDLALRLVNLDIANALAVLARGDRSIPIHCVVADFGARDGVLTPRTLVLDAAHTVAHGEGQIDLRSERIELRMRAEPKDGSLFALRGPIQVGGTFADPSVRPDLASALARGGAAIALGILGTPAAAVIPFVQFGKAEEQACAQRMEQVARDVAEG
jgi:AsmA family